MKWPRGGREAKHGIRVRPRGVSHSHCDSTASGRRQKITGKNITCADPSCVAQPGTLGNALNDFQMQCLHLWMKLMAVPVSQGCELLQRRRSMSRGYFELRTISTEQCLLPLSFRNEWWHRSNPANLPCADPASGGKRQQIPHEVLMCANTAESRTDTRK